MSSSAVCFTAGATFREFAVGNLISVFIFVMMMVGVYTLCLNVLLSVREYFFSFFLNYKNVNFYGFLKWHLKKGKNVIQVSESFMTLL